jgi:glutaredoxin
MTIEILIFDGCPNSEAAENLVRETVGELGIDAEIKVINVIDNEDAVAKRFLGSPSIRINGRDLEIEEDRLTQYSMKCRIYRHGESQSGVPSKELLKSKILAVANR